MTDTNVCELVCTRISHDIVGNIGAVANAVELLEEGDMEFIDDIISILKTSSITMSARMKFFRLAFGLSNPNLENEDFVKQTAQNYLLTIGNKDYPITLDFNIKDVAKRKAALVMVMIMADLLIRGGNISIWDDNDSLIAQIGVGAKLSDDKLNKVKKALSTDLLDDAVLAPISALKDMTKGQKINLVDDNGFIKLMVE